MFYGQVIPESILAQLRSVYRHVKYWASNLLVIVTLYVGFLTTSSRELSELCDVSKLQTYIDCTIFTLCIVYELSVLLALFNAWK